MNSKNQTFLQLVIVISFFLMSYTSDTFYNTGRLENSNCKSLTLVQQKGLLVLGEDNKGWSTTCDSTSAFFSNDILPILKNYCIGCHNKNFLQGNVNLENYEEILPYAKDGSLLGSIQHDAEFSIMPPFGNKLSECQIGQIKKWIEEGAQKN